MTHDGKGEPVMTEQDRRVEEEYELIKKANRLASMDSKEAKRRSEYVCLAEYTYGNALKKVLEIRNQRQKIYADDWKNQEEWELLALIKMKVKRLEHFIIDRKDQTLYEGKVDCAVDGVNYLLFLLQNIIDKEERKR